MTNFRVFNGSGIQNSVQNIEVNHYPEITIDLAIRKRDKWKTLSYGEYSIKDILDMLDESTSKLSGNNTVRAFQTAERLRREFPDEDWLHLTGLIHDLGNIIYYWGEPKHLVSGENYVVGQYSLLDSVNSIKLNANNPDCKCGIYNNETGLDDLILSWGHDEYMYHVLEGNDSLLPKFCHRIIRYHSFYLWHTRGAYRQLTNRKDQQELMPLVKKFSEYDFYDKMDPVPNVSLLWETYYLGLCKKYGLDGKLRW